MVFQAAKRFVSVDVLRGFDMFWIVGGAEFAQALAALFGQGVHHPVAMQMEHVPWDGFHFMDLIFPLFVFMAGMSTVFSLDKLLETKGKAAAWKRLLKRSILLYLCGLFYYNGMADGVDSIRYVGVLQRIAISSLFAGIGYIYCGKRGLLTILGAILAGYYILLAFVPIPGETDIFFTVEKNWAVWIDKHYLFGHRWNGDWDPEGLLSSIPAIASCLLGVLAGMMMKDKTLADIRRLKHFVVWGIGCLVVGYVWSFHFPIIKVLWTSSFVLWAAGWSFLLLALFYWLTDIKGWQKWASPFVWIGTNSITIYMVVSIVDFYGLANRLVGEDIATLIGETGTVFVSNTIQMLMVLLFVRFLYKKKIFLRL
ncbi:MAG: acyltransferase family protein [Planctomycetota bacterium]